MNELTSSPIRCPCGELEELRKAKAELSDKLKKSESAELAWRQEYHEAHSQHMHFREENRQLRKDNAQLKRTILTLCGVVKVLLGETGE